MSFFGGWIFIQYLYQCSGWPSLQFDTCDWNKCSVSPFPCVLPVLLSTRVRCVEIHFASEKGRGQEEQKLDMSGVWLISTKGQIGTYCSTECSLPPCINQPRRRRSGWSRMFQMTRFWSCLSWNRPTSPVFTPYIEEKLFLESFSFIITLLKMICDTADNGSSGFIFNSFLVYLFFCCVASVHCGILPLIKVGMLSSLLDKGHFSSNNIEAGMKSDSGLLAVLFRLINASVSFVSPSLQHHSLPSLFQTYANCQESTL